MLYKNLRDGVTGEARELLIEDGRVVAYARTIDNPNAPTEDLGGRAVLPGFVDAHCHILPTGLDLLSLNLAEADTREAVLDRVRDGHHNNPDGWLVAVHYDQNRFADGLHLTRDALDAISSARPILLRHANGHAGVANSAALLQAGVRDDTSNPSGGAFGRDAGGRPDGVLFERALEEVADAIPLPSVEAMTEAIVRAARHMRGLGIVAAADMMTGRFSLLDELEAYGRASEAGAEIATRLYLQWGRVFGPRAPDGPELEDALTRLRRIGGRGSRAVGIKIFADGAIASGTAAIYGSYVGEAVAGPAARRHGRNAHAAPARSVSGQLIYRPERLRDMVRVAADAGYPVAVHAIGDQAVDLVMDAFAATDDPTIHRIEHAMILSDAQIARLAKLGCSVCFQPEFLLRFGHAYRRQLGDARASRLKRTRSVLDAGIPLAFSSDRPVVPGDPWDGIRMAVDREGFDPAERCTRAEALRAYTETAAQLCGDAGVFGAFTSGAVAEFQVLD